MLKKKFICLVLILFQGSFTFLAAQSFPELRFRHITTQNGLSSDIATSAAEDSSGFIWIGTNNGLNRYDGYRIKQYFHDEADSQSLANNVIHSVQVDDQGRIWISTDVGLSCFLPAKNYFVNYNTKAAAERRILENKAGPVFIDKKAVWILNQRGSIFKVKNDFSLERLVIHTPSHEAPQPAIQGYLQMYRDGKRNVWACAGSQLYRVDSVTMQPLQSYDLARIIDRGIITQINADHENNLWLSTYGSGVWKFNTVTGKTEQIKMLPKDTYSSLQLWQCKQQRFIVTTREFSSLCLVDDRQQLFKELVWNPNDRYSINGNEFYNLLVDHFNNLWVCTNQGLNYSEMRKNVFDLIPITEPGTQNYAQDKKGSVFSFYEDRQNCWLSKRGISTFLLDPAMKIKKVFTSLYPLSTVRSNWKMNGYYYYRKNEDWYITTDSGLVKYHSPDQTSQLFLPKQDVTAANMRTIIPFNKDEIMIRSYRSGIYVFNTTSQTFTHYYRNNDSCIDCLPYSVNYLFKTSGKNIYATGDNKKALMVYDKRKDAFQPVIFKNSTGFPTDARSFFGIDEAMDHKLWIASDDGVFTYNPANGEIEEHYTANGKLGACFRVCFDNENNAWVNATSGIWCYLFLKNKWINFSSKDGLTGGDFEGVLAKRANGDIIAGLEGALALFHPDQLNNISGQIPPVITEANVEQRNFVYSLYAGNQKKLTIEPGKNSFSVDFALLDYAGVNSDQYLYKLEPLMKDYQWNSDGHINFNGLSPGEYTLHVKGADKAGNIFSKEDVLYIVVQPRWYETTLFELFIAIGSIMLVFLFVNRRIKAIRKQSLLRQKIAETEMQALRAQMNPHFIFNCLNSIENFIMKNDKRMASDYLNKFARLIRMILDSSRNELVPFSKDMEALQLYIDMEQLRFQHKFTYSNYVDPQLLNGDYHVPSLLIQPYIENAILHGLAHSQRDDLCLIVSASLENEKIKYTIQDNGVGREQAMIYKEKNKPQHKSVGLKITQERINIFNKQIDSKNSVCIIDLFDGQHQPVGTKVEIRINTN